MGCPDAVALHVCCGPCLAAARETLRRDEGNAFPPIGRIIFYNPNIHPLLEFRRRVKALSLYLERDPLPAEIDDTYGLSDYLARVIGDAAKPLKRRDRCYRCYLFRLEKTAELARMGGFEAISTTLLASREQDRDLVAQAGREAARRLGLEFLEADLRKYLPPDKIMRGIYKQQYCGCIFSEEERFRGTTKHIYYPGGKRPEGDAPVHEE